jgi:hypothetical protein
VAEADPNIRKVGTTLNERIPDKISNTKIARTVGFPKNGAPLIPQRFDYG